MTGTTRGLQPVAILGGVQGRDASEEKSEIPMLCFYWPGICMAEEHHLPNAMSYSHVKPTCQ